MAGSFMQLCAKYHGHDWISSLKCQRQILRSITIEFERWMVRGNTLSAIMFMKLKLLHVKMLEDFQCCTRQLTYGTPGTEVTKIFPLFILKSRLYITPKVFKLSLRNLVLISECGLWNRVLNLMMIYMV